MTNRFTFWASIRETVTKTGGGVHAYRSVEAVTRRGDVNALWSFLQLNVEYEKLDHALHQFELDPTSITMDKLELRYDLFLSRFSALESGSARTLMQDEPIYSHALAALQRFVAAGDSYFGASVDATSSQTNMRRLRIEPDGLRETVQELSLSASRVGPAGRLAQRRGQAPDLADHRAHRLPGAAHVFARLCHGATVLAARKGHSPGHGSAERVGRCPQTQRGGAGGACGGAHGGAAKGQRGPA